MNTKLVGSALYLAWADTKSRYKKSVLGPFWLTLGNIIGVVGLSLVWATLLGQDMSTLVPSLSVGLIIWQLIAGTLSEGTTVFVRDARTLKNVTVPMRLFIYRALARQSINFFHNIIIIVGVFWYFDLTLSLITLFSVVGIVLVFANLFWILYLLSILGARFRDLEFIINATLPILFFVSPVIFRSDQLAVKSKIIWYNPLSYFIEVIRKPILGEIPSPNIYLVLVLMLVVGSIITISTIRKYNKYLLFWI